MLRGGLLRLREKRRKKIKGLFGLFLAGRRTNEREGEGKSTLGGRGAGDCS